jgi:dynein heavy chain, axonemal
MNIEILGNLRCIQGFYDRGKDLNWKMIKGVQTLGAMGPPGGARNQIDPRLASLFMVFELESPALSSLKTIFNSILQSHSKSFVSEVQGEHRAFN